MVDLETKLTKEARRVRDFLECHGPRGSDLFRDFPLGACGNASDVLGQWLKDRNFPGVAYVHGSRTGRSHGWLECEGLIIDITSDQFIDGHADVYVGLPNCFHASFGNQNRSAPSLASSLEQLYGDMVRSFSTYMDA